MGLVPLWRRRCSSLSPHVCTEDSPHEHTARRQASARQEDSPPQNLTMLAPCSQTSSLQNWEKYLLFKAGSLWYFVVAAELTKTLWKQYNSEGATNQEFGGQRQELQRIIPREQDWASQSRDWYYSNFRIAMEQRLLHVPCSSSL